MRLTHPHAEQPAGEANAVDPLAVGPGLIGPGEPPMAEPIEDGATIDLDDPRCYFSRDASWLEFNRRVLALACDERTPLLERAKFLSICASNLDEFFMKRVGLFRRAIVAGAERTSHDGLSVRGELARCRAVACDLQTVMARCWNTMIRPGLEAVGVTIVEPAELTESDLQRLDAWFMQEVFPVLTPLAVDKGHRFPFISNLSESLGVLVSPPGGGERLFARVKIPDVVPRLVAIPEDDRTPIGTVPHNTPRVRFVQLERIMQRNLDDVFPGMKIVDVMPFRLTRSAAVNPDEDEHDDLLEAVQAQLETRRFAEAVRLETPVDGSDGIIDFLQDELKLDDADIFKREGLLEYADLAALNDLDRPDLRYPAFTGVVPPRLRNDERSIFDTIAERDVFLHHPYESFAASVERFIAAAADDPNVLAIKQTLYRTSRDSPFIDSLIRAAQQGKQVACLVELRARFDEDKNVRFAQQLEKHGVHVAYGVEGLKTHCKCSLVVRREPGGVKTYAHVGTGNYHPGTAQLYTDCGLLTTNPDITADVISIFNYLTGRSRNETYRKLLVAPITMRDRFYELIDREADNARAGRPARVVCKMNQLEDPGIIKRLYEASRAGVRVTVITRGFCCIRPGVEGLSENVEIISVVGRFLEHSRIFHFAGGHEDWTEGEWYIGSADWMSRNLTNRVESISPVEDRAARRRLVEIMEVGLRDRRDSWTLRSDGVYVPRTPTTEGSQSADSPETIGTFETLCRAALMSTIAAG